MDFFGDFPGDLEVPEKRGEGRSLSISNFWDSEGLALWTQQHQMKMVVNWDFQGLFIRIRFIEMLQYLYCIGLYIARNFGICMEIVAFVVIGPRRFSHQEWLIFSNLVDPFWLWTAGRSWKPFIQGWKLIVVIGKRQHLTNFAGRLFRHAFCGGIKTSTSNRKNSLKSICSQDFHRFFTTWDHETPPPSTTKESWNPVFATYIICTYSSQTFDRILLASLPGRGRV